MRQAAVEAAPASRMGRWPWELLALPLLGVARLLPETEGGLYFRLAAATLCLLVPGALAARALGRPSVFATLTWSLFGLTVASAYTFAAHGPLWFMLALYAGFGAVALPFAFRHRLAPPGMTAIAVGATGVFLGIALWSIAGSLDGDAIFHLARIRKLDAFESVSLRSVDEFIDGGLHPGYAFPLWHVFVALIGKVAGVDPAAVLLHEPSLLVPLAFLVAYEAGVAIFRTAWAGVAALLAQVALSAMAPGSGGAYTSLALPASSARHLLVPAVVAAFFVFAEDPGVRAGATVVAASLALSFIHPTYVVFVILPLAGYVVARAVLARGEVVRGLAAIGCVAVPAAGVALWLAPIVDDTASHNPSAAERARGLAHYPGQVDVISADRIRLAPEMLGRPGAVAIAALIAVPLAALASRRRWAAYVLGGSVAMCAVLLLPDLFTRFSDAVSLSQARRAAGFLPLAAAFAGGAAVLAKLLSWWALPIALGGGIALELTYPGEFTYAFHHGAPAFVAWIALAGGVVALIAAALLGRRGTLDDRGPLSAGIAAAFVAPVIVFGFGHWTTAPFEPTPLTGGLVRQLHDLPPGSVVFSDDSTSYWLASVAPLYVASARPGHVADTKQNRPYERRDDADRFGRTGELQIPGAYRADYVLVDRDRWKRLPPLKLQRVYADPHYVLYRM